MRGGIMAKAKAPKGDVPKKRTKPPKVIGVYSTAEWASWLDGVAVHYRTTVAGVIDRALTEWTESNGYPIRPPKRTR